MISIITTCKGRMHHIISTLPNNIFLKFPYEFEYIVVDYGDQDNVFEWCIEQSNPYLKSVKVLEDTDFFDPSRARNFGAKVAKGEVLVFVDGDVFLKQSWVDSVLPLLTSKKFDLAYPKCVDDKFGTCCVSKKAFDKINGYDELLKGWGWQDFDFYRRCKNNKLPRFKFECNLIDVIKHSDKERVANYKVKSLDKTVRDNRSIANRTHRVNVAGYALGNYRYYDHRDKSSRPVRWF